MIAKVVSSNQRDWSEKLPFVELAYNCSIHSSTGYSPFFLVLGRHPNLPLDFVSQAPRAEMYKDYDDYTEQVEKRMREALSFVRQNIKTSFNRNKRIYDSRVKEMQFLLEI